MSNEKYGITDAHYICDSAIFNTETNEILRLYQICDLLNEQDQKIKNLEDKLAEKTEQLKIALKDFNDIQQENDKLAQQLAEKEKKIESCNHTIYMNMLNQEMLQLKVANLEQSQNQTAIAELEKVKEFCNNPLIQNVYGNIPEFRVENFIEQQIKELKRLYGRKIIQCAGVMCPYYSLGCKK